MGLIRLMGLRQRRPDGREKLPTRTGQLAEAGFHAVAAVIQIVCRSIEHHSPFVDQYDAAANRLDLLQDVR